MSIRTIVATGSRAESARLWGSPFGSRNYRPAVDRNQPKLFAEIANLGHQPAEGGQAQGEKREEHAAAR